MIDPLFALAIAAIGTLAVVYLGEAFERLVVEVDVGGPRAGVGYDGAVDALRAVAVDHEVGDDDGAGGGGGRLGELPADGVAAFGQVAGDAVGDAGSEPALQCEKIVVAGPGAVVGEDGIAIGAELARVRNCPVKAGPDLSRHRGVWNEKSIVRPWRTGGWSIEIENTSATVICSVVSLDKIDSRIT